MNSDHRLITASLWAIHGSIRAFLELIIKPFFLGGGIDDDEEDDDEEDDDENNGSIKKVKSAKLWAINNNENIKSKKLFFLQNKNIWYAKTHHMFKTP